MVSAPKPGKWIKNRFNKAVYKAVSKFNYPTSTFGGDPRMDVPEPPYQRQIHPRWIYNLRQNSTLINNSIEEKVSQTFRRGFTEWEKEYKAKCPVCKHEFHTLEPFKQQLGAFGEALDDEDIDLDSERICPECEDRVEMMTPDDEDKEHAEQFFQQANEKTDIQTHLEPRDQNSVGQTFAEVCKELAWDIQSFDDAWLLFQREYTLDPESGVILDYELKGISRAPPEIMRYSVDEEGKFGNEYWVCPKCRGEHKNYKAEKEPVDCSDCGGHTYPAYAVSLNEPSGDPTNYYIRGEFVHASEYEPKKYYGYSPILTLWEEARTLEQMDDWYKSAYKERRAPRGAMLVRSSNAESVRAHNQGQMEKLKGDRHYIPTFIDDTDGSGKALEWVNLLEDPAEMQHMEMRNWFLERISAKYGVTPVFQKGSPNNSGLSQSLEIVVSNRSADRLRRIFNDTFIPAFIGQLQAEGWTRELRPVEEDDEAKDADVQGKFVQNAKRAKDAGFEVEWTEDDKLKIHPGKPKSEEDEEQGGGGPPIGDVAGGGPGGQPESPPGAPPQIENASVTSGSSGWSNVRYGGRGEQIDILGNLRDMLEEEEEKIDKSMEDMTWDDIDIKETVRIWIDDPDEAPKNATVSHDPDGAPAGAEYYYEEELNSISVNKAQYINKRAVAIDFFWRRRLVSIIKQDNEESGYDPYEPPEDCNRVPVENATGNTLNEAQVFVGPQGGEFYCSNYKETGTWDEDSQPYDPQNIIEPNEELNTKMEEGHDLTDHEALFDFNDWSDVDRGQTIVVDSKDRDGLERFQYLENTGFGSIALQDSEGNVHTVKVEELENRTQGVVGELVDKKYDGRYKDYEPPSDIYSQDNVQKITDLPSDEGGINSRYTKIVELETGEEVIYKNYKGNSHEWCLDGDAMAYETYTMISDGDTFPETARTDLGHGFGSAQQMIENAQSFRDATAHDGVINENAFPREDEVIMNNVENIAEMTLVDYITGNTDRHADNFMITEDNLEVKAIDSGGHATPAEEPKDLSSIALYRDLRHPIVEWAADEEEREEKINEFFDGIESELEDKLNNVVDNREEILQQAESFYGPLSPVTERIQNLLEEIDDGKLYIDEALIDDIERLREAMINDHL